MQEIKEFNIQNTGIESLEVSGIVSSNSGVFQVSGITLPSEIAVSSSDTFSVIFTTETSQVHSGIISIYADIENQTNPYIFRVQGEYYSGTGYVVGGYASGTTFDYNEAYNSSSDDWSIKTPVTYALRAGGGFTLNNDGYITAGYVGGPGTDSLNKYSKLNNSWVTKAQIVLQLAYTAACSLSEKGYVIGGTGSFDSTDNNREYDYLLNTWTLKRKMTTSPRSGLACFELTNVAVTFGGNYLSSYYNVTESYHPTVNSWASRDTLSGVRVGMAGFSIANPNYGFSVSGKYASTSYTKTVERFSGSSWTWSTRTSLSGARAYSTGFVIESSGYVVGGYYSGYKSTIEEYDNDGDSWSSKSSATYGRSEVQSFSL